MQAEEEAIEAHTPIPDTMMQELYCVLGPDHCMASPYITEADGQTWCEALREAWQCDGVYDPAFLKSLRETGLRPENQAVHSQGQASQGRGAGGSLAYGAGHWYL